MRIELKQLKAFLLGTDLITKEKLRKAGVKAKKSKRSLEEEILKEKLISRDELIKLKAYILGIPFINLEKEIIPREILKIIPEPIAKKNNIVAFKKKDNTLEVAMLDPEDLETIGFIKKKANLKILPRLTSMSSIKHVLKQYEKSLEAEFEEIVKKKTLGEIKVVGVKRALKKEKDLRKVAQEMPVIKIVDTLLKHAILENASDIHIEPQEREIIVRFRIDGLLREAMTLPRQILAGVVARIKVLANLKLDEHRLPQDGRFKIDSEDYRYSLRVSVLPVSKGEKVVMRLLKESGSALTLEELGLFEDNFKVVKRNIKKPTGMILVTGPTGCGKTTTLYSIMNILNVPKVNISTIEDPIEYRMPKINQTQVKPKIGLTFASGLRALLRQDPDIIMVGEIRDKETAGIAVHAALTGHLVLSTLHTNSAAGTLPRLLDMNIEPYLIASTVNVIIAQRLVRKICPDCKEKYRLDSSTMAVLRKQFNLKRILEILKSKKLVPQKSNFSDIAFSRGKGCSRCRKEGYRGRIGIFEVVEVDEEIGNLLAQRPTTDQLEAKTRQKGMIFMYEDGFIKTVQGLTTIDEVMRVTKE